jgi:hypothetical protein
MNTRAKPAAGGLAIFTELWSVSRQPDRRSGLKLDSHWGSCCPGLQPGLPISS